MSTRNKSVLIFFLAALLQTISYAQLILNPDFEEAGDNDAPADWIISKQGESEILIDTENKISGNNSLRITHQEEDSFTQVYQKIKVNSNTKYKLTLQGMTENLNGQGAGPRLFITDGDSKVELASAYITSSKWTKISLVIDTREYEEINLRCYLHKKSGSAWFDDLVMIEVKKADAATLSLAEKNIWVFRCEDDFLGWTAPNFQDPKVQKNAFRGKTIFDPGKKTPFLYSPNLKADASLYNGVELKMKSSLSMRATILFRKTGEIFDGLKYSTFQIMGDANFHTYLVDMESTQWNGTIEQLRFDLFADGADLEVPYIMLVKKDTNEGLIVNGGFEKYNYEEKIDGWLISGGGITVALTNSKKSEGENSLFFKGTGKISLLAKDLYVDFLDPLDQYALSFDYLLSKSPDQPALNLSVTGYDSFDKIIFKKDKKLDLQKTSAFATISEIFPSFPREMYKIDVQMEGIFAGAAELYLDNFSWHKIKFSAESSFSPIWDDWQGEWIRPGTKESKGEDQYFRKTFVLDSLPISAGFIISSCDYTTNIYINEKPLPLGKNYNKPYFIDEYDIAPYLVKGTNIVAIQVKNKWTYGGLLCEGGITLENDRHVLIKSDSSFRMTTNYFSDWNEPGFNDAKWTSFYSLGSPPGAFPFWSMPHTYQGPRPMVEITDLSFSAGTDKENKFILQLKFIPKEKGLGFTVKLKSGNNSFTLLNKKLPGLVPERENIYITNLIVPDLCVRAANWDLSIESERALFTTKYKKIKIQNSAAVLSGIVLRGEPEKKLAVELKIKDGQVPFFQINDQPWDVIHHWTGGIGSITETKLCNCRENGVHLYWGMMSKPGWLNENTYDFNKIDEFVMKILEIDPEARIMLQVSVAGDYDDNSMKLWEEKYPDELVKDSDGNTKIEFYSKNDKRSCPSWASKVWLKIQKNNLREIIKYVNKQPYANRVIGYMPLNGLGVEWTFWGTFFHSWLDYSTPFLTGFQEFAEKKYKTISALNSAYKATYKDFSGIKLPTKEERSISNYYFFIDPQKNQRLIDFRQFFSEVSVNAIVELGKVVKEETGGQALYGTFYGYIMEPVKQWSESGSFGLTQILKAKEVDFLVAEFNYVNRFIGQENGYFIPPESMLLNNKMAYIQLDLRTHRAPKGTSESGFGRCKDIRESISVWKRDFIHTTIDGGGFEFGYFGFGWDTEDKRIMEVIGKSRELENFLRNIGRKTMDGETSVAVIVDDISTYSTLQDSETNWMIHWNMVTEQFMTLYHSGAGVDHFTLADLPLMPEYKCYMFLNTFNISDEQKTWIEKNLKKDNKTIIWVYAPGILTSTSLNAKRIADITGIKMEVKEEAIKPTVEITDNKDPVTIYCKAGDSYTYKGIFLGPVIIPAEGKILGKLKDRGEAALAVKRFANWTSVYSYSPNLPAVLLRGIVKNAGVHIANYEESDSTFISDKLLGIHTSGGGKRTFYAPAKYKTKARELYLDKEFPLKNGCFEFDCDPLSTYLFMFE